MRRHGAVSCAILLHFLLAGLPLSAQVRVHYPDRAYSSISVGNAQWIGSPRGLYRYRFDDNVWATYGRQNGLRSPRITALEQRNDVLWIAQEGALSSFDLRSNSMLHFDSSSGLPLREIRAIAFEGEYTWAGGRGGAARYDELIEEWQFIGGDAGLQGGVVHAMLASEGRMFFATDLGIEEYDPRFERWRQYPLPTEVTIIDGFATERWLWLLHDGGLLRFDLSSRNYVPLRFQGFSGSDIGVVLIDGDSFWLRTSDDLWQYDATADALRPFLAWERLPDRDLREVAIAYSGSLLWFSTASGITSYRPEDGNTTYYTEAGGMPGGDIDAMFLLGNGVAAFTGDALIYLIADENRWYSVPLLQEERAGGPRLSLDPAAGSYVDFGNDWKLDLSGSRSAWLFEDPFGTNEFVFNGEDPVKRNDLKARLDLGGGRRISALYNDADFEDVTYGVEYRGARDDVPQSLQWGDIRREQGMSVLGQSIGLFGVGGRAVYGERSERYGRSLVELSAVSGHKTTARHTEVFHGRQVQHSRRISDASWRGYRWFYLRSDRTLQSFDGENVRLYLALVPGETRAPGDLLQTEIAGMINDWRPLAEGIDYAVNRDESVLEFLVDIMPVALAVGFRSGGQDAELLLSNGSSPHLLEVRNRYHLGTSILPSSLQLRILGPDSSSVPLSQFGIDENGDGRVDAAWVDFESGVLRFPEAEPFPPAAYTDRPVTTYTLQVEYTTFSSSYWLARRRILRGSEQILVDGLPVNAGEDYILDYTSGILVFTRDGAVLDDSRVEISYEYVHNVPEERMSQATLTLSPSDFTQASVSGGRFTEDGASIETNFIQGAGELRWQSDAVDIRLQPEYRHTWSDSAQGDAAGLAATLSTEAARLSLRSSIRGDGYREPTAAAYAGGRLRDDHAVKAEYDISSSLRAFADWRKRSGVDTLSGQELEDRALGGGLQWVRQDWPSVTLRGNILDETDVTGERSRESGRLDFTWVPSSLMLEALGFDAARLTGYARYGREELTSLTSATASQAVPVRQHHIQNYYLRSVLSPRQLFTINAWYLGDKREQGDEGDVSQPDYQRDRLFVDVLMEHLRGLSLGSRLTADERRFWTTAGSYDQYSSTTAQLNLRIAPGTWIPLLQPFTLYTSVQRSVSRSFHDGRSSGGLFTTFFSAADGSPRSESGLTSYETRLEWRPSAELLYSVTARLYENSSRRYGYETGSDWYDIQQRVDYRPDGFSLYGAQFYYRSDNAQQSINDSRRYNPQVWAERRFSRHLLLRLMCSYASMTQSSVTMENTLTSLSPSGYITLSYDALPVLRRVELRLDAGYDYSTTGSRLWIGEHTTKSYATFYNKLYLDLYPHPVLFIRFRYYLRWRSDNTSSHLNYSVLGIDGWDQPDAQLQLIMQL